MFDPRFPHELADLSAKTPPSPPDEVSRVQEVLTKLESVSPPKVSGIEAPLAQLDRAGKDLRTLADQMGDYHQSFQAMQTWQALLEDAYRNPSPDA